MLFAIVLAAGRGERFGTKPKCFVNLYGKKLIEYSLLRFLLLGVDAIFVAVPQNNKNFLNLTRRLALKYHRRYPNTHFYVLYGGNTRRESFRKCFEKMVRKFGVSEDDILIEHDGARPLFSLKLLKDMIKLIRDTKADGVIPFITPVETVRIVKLNKNSGAFTFVEELDRNNIALIQTPQVFRVKSVYEVMRREELRGSGENVNFTDLAGILFKHKKRLYGIIGERKNIKITFPPDLEVVKAILRSKERL